MKKKIVAVVSACVLLVTLCVVAAGCGGCGAKTYTVETSMADLPKYSSYTDMIASIRPGVVEVYCEGYDDSGTAIMTSAGAGVIVGKSDDSLIGDGYFIVTNHHVIENCYSMIVNVLSIGEDGSENTTAYSAQLIGGSHERDIAVLYVKTTATLTTATWLADGDELQVGAEVVAIGNPTGTLGGTVTRGIVSATSRKINVENIGSMDLIQMDAAINSGNSGGGLFYTYESADGEWSAALAGIVNSGATGYDGLGFAIPAEDAMYAVEKLTETYGTDDELYGYVPGDVGLTITAAVGNVYNSSLSGQETIVYADDTSNEDLDNVLDTYEEYRYGTSRQSFDALRKIVVTDSETGKQTETEITAAQDVYDALAGADAGDSVTITVEAVETYRMGPFGGILCLSGETEDVAIDSLSQYRYTPPDAPSFS